MRFGILGPLEVWEDGRQLALGPGKQRALLLFLLLHSNEVVSPDRLVDQLWDGEPPATAKKVVQNYVSQLRRALGTETLLTKSGGYLLRVGMTDAGVFESAVDAARLQAPALAARALREALGLWRGRALADVEYAQWAEPEIRRLEELRLVALEDRIEAELQLGEHERLVPELTALVRAHPFRERLGAQLMLALYRSERQADALTAYAETRRRLVDELGIEPGPELQELQRRILVQDAELGPARRRLSLSTQRLPLALMLAGAALVLVAATATLVELLSRSAGNPPLAAEAVAAIDPSGDRVLGDLPLAGAPSRLVVEGGLVWVANDASGTVSAINPDTRAIVRSVNVGGFPSDMAAGGGAVWVIDGKGGLLTKISPGYGVAARVKVVAANAAYDESREGLDPVSIATDSRSVWVTDGSRTLTRVDAASAHVAARIDLHRPLDGVAAAQGSVWVISGPAATLFRLSARTNRVTARIPIVSSPGFQSPYPLAVAAGVGAVWVLNGNTATVTRIDPRERTVAATIPIGIQHGPLRLAADAHAVWVTNSDGTLSRLNPTNDALNTISIARPVEDVTTTAGQVWLTTGTGLVSAAGSSASASRIRALPASSCSPIYGQGGQPQYLLVADLPLQGYERVVAAQANQAIEFLLTQQHFRAGRYSIGYQACDDSTAASGFAAPARCAANARTYASHPSVLGVIGPLDSYCARIEVPIANRARGGALAFIGPTNTYVGLTHAGPGTARGEPGRYYPTSVRNYVRIIPADDIQAAADAVLAKRLHAQTIYLIADQPGNGYGVGLTDAFALAARKLGLRIVGVGTWDYRHPKPMQLAARAHQLGATAVFIGAAAVDDPPIGTLIRALHARAIRVIAPDAFSEFAKLVQFAGAAAQGVMVSVPGLPISRFSTTGKAFAAAFGHAVGQTPSQYSLYAAQAAAVMLDAIARSNGTRNSVRTTLLATKTSNGITGTFSFNKNGDTTADAVTIYQIVAANPHVAQIITPNPDLLTTPSRQQRR